MLIGLKPLPANMPQHVDFEGIAQLATAAKEHGVKRIVAVTTASTGSPWAPAAIFLNSVCFMSVKWKFFGEQAIRESGLDYVIIRPFGLVDTPLGKETEMGIDCSQSPTSGMSRRIPREDVASLCHEALRTPSTRTTFECWSTPAHKEPLPWHHLKPDSAE